MEKIVRTICYFTEDPDSETERRLEQIKEKLEDNGYEVQTRRICSPQQSFTEFKEKFDDESLFLGIGTKNFQQVESNLDDFLEAGDVNFNLDLTDEKVEGKHADILFKIIEENPSSTFSFCYTFNNNSSSPYMPAADYREEGFTVGLQPTNLSKNCKTLDEWLENMKRCWEEIENLFKDNDDYLGIDSSIAPFSDGDGSLINFIKRLDMTFEQSVSTETYMEITEFINSENPNPVGLCGLMLPCLEDFELADKYEEGEFSIERNLFLSLHSGLGIDVYPVGVDEEKEKIVDILRTVRRLSNKYNKPLSVRFVSDGDAEIGDRTDFGNQYLKDVKVRKL